MELQSIEGQEELSLKLCSRDEMEVILAAANEGVAASMSRQSEPSNYDLWVIENIGATLEDPNSTKHSATYQVETAKTAQRLLATFHSKTAVCVSKLASKPDAFKDIRLPLQRKQLGTMAGTMATELAILLDVEGVTSPGFAGNDS